MQRPGLVEPEVRPGSGEGFNQLMALEVQLTKEISLEIHMLKLKKLGLEDDFPLQMGGFWVRC